MCDYSLAVVPNRLAIQGEQLVVHRFSSGTKGLASPADLERRKIEELVYHSRWQRTRAALVRFFSADTISQPPAVCVPPGASLVLRDLGTSLQKRFEIDAEEVVTFSQIHPIADRHRDGVRFRNGRTALLQEFEIGQRVDVMALNPAETEAPPEVLSSVRV